MFNVGGGELLVIMVLALIVLGPQRLPDAARQVGKVMGDLRRLSSGFQNEMKTAFTEADDPTRVSARRNVLAKETPVAADDPVDEEVDEEVAVSEAVAALSDHPVATPKKAPPARAKTTSTTAKKAIAAKNAPAKNAPAVEPVSADEGVPEAPPPRSTS